MFQPLNNDYSQLPATLMRRGSRFCLAGISLALALGAVSACSDDDPVAAAAGGDAGEGGEPAEGGAGGEGGTGGEGGDGGEPSAGGEGGEGGAGGEGGMAGMAGAAGMPGEFDGQTVFRHDTFGDEQVWTDVLQMHEVIASSVSPMTALAV